jgi:hypothetical protein
MPTPFEQQNRDAVVLQMRREYPAFKQLPFDPDNVAFYRTKTKFGSRSAGVMRALKVLTSVDTRAVLHKKRLWCPTRNLTVRAPKVCGLHAAALLPIRTADLHDLFGTGRQWSKEDSHAGN